LSLESYVTTDGQSFSRPWNIAPIWDSRPDFITVRQSRVFLCGVLSMTRGRVCRLQSLLALASAVILGSESRATRDYILLSQIRDISFCRLLRLAGLQWRYSTQSNSSFSLWFSKRLSRCCENKCFPSRWLAMDVYS
jgi:hypothetical protein